MTRSLQTTDVVILGAGFSVAATDGKMPLMRNYFSQLLKQDAPELYAFVEETTGEVETANVESVLLSLGQIQCSPNKALEGWGDHHKRNCQAIRRQLSDYTLRRMIDSLDFACDNWAIQILADCGPATTIISMNYDNIAERCLSNRQGITHRYQTRTPTCPHCKMCLLMEKACSCSGKGDVLDHDYIGSIIKPHGSIAWRRCLNPTCCSHECLVADAHCQPCSTCPCPKCGESAVTSMVMPSMNKNLDEIPEIGLMWNAARRAVAAAESMVFFGFSFPASDELLTQMIRSAIHANKKLKRIAVIDLDPLAVIGRFERCIPKDLQVEVTPLKVIPGEKPDWIVSESSPRMQSTTIA